VVGNRPQFVKAAAVSPPLGERAEEILIHAGQHYDESLSEVFFEELGLRAPDRVLTTGSGTHAEQTAKLLRALEPALSESTPDCVLVYGDTNTTLAATLAAAKLFMPVVHVEAGMRSFERAMPEEVNRLVTDSLAGLLLCSTEASIDNLRREGAGERSRLVGDVMADVARVFGPIAERRSTILERLSLRPRSYALATVHRQQTVDDDQALARAVSVLNRIADEMPVLLPVHPRTGAQLQRTGLESSLAEGVTMLEPLGYLDFGRLLRNAAAVVTDSGGVQKEAYLAAVPCLTLRERTEWVETVESGWNRLVGLDPAKAAAALEELAGASATGMPHPALYGDGHAAERVAEAVASWISGAEADRR
jgi:UDP-N-acetylglucosamine 2-epimerase